MEDGAEVEDSLGGAGRVVYFFCMNPTSILPSTILPEKGGNSFDFFGGGLARFEVGLGLGSFFRVSWSSYLQSYLESYPNPTKKVVEIMGLKILLIYRGLKRLTKLVLSRNFRAGKVLYVFIF
jgi:hypothetical protein